MSRQKMEEELTCPICMELFCHPRRLPCGHSYCQACIRAMLDSKAEESGMYHNYFRPLICPECRDEVSVDFVQGVEGLPLDFKLSKLVELVQFMKAKGDSSSGGEEPCSRGPDVRRDNRRTNSANQASHLASNIGQVSSPSFASNIDHREEPQGTSSSTVASKSAVADTTNTFLTPGELSLPALQAERLQDISVEGAADGVDQAVRFDSLLCIRQDGSSSSHTASVAENPIHFSLSSLPENNLATFSSQNPPSLPQHGDSSLKAAACHGLSVLRGISSDSARASSLPPPETATASTSDAKESGEITGVQPSASASFSSLPAAAIFSAASATGTAPNNVDLRGQEELNKEKAKNKTSAPAQLSDGPPKSNSTPHQFRWRNLFVSTSSSSSSWSASDSVGSADSQDSEVDPTKQDLKRKPGQNHDGPTPDPTSDSTAAGCGNVSSTASAAVRQSKEVPAANRKETKKSKKWLMTRFLRSVVFSDSSSTYGSSDSNIDDDDDVGVRPGRQNNAADGDFVSSSVVNQSRLSTQGQTSSSLPNIASAASSQRGPLLLGLQASQTCDNINHSVGNAAHNQTQLEAQSSTEIRQIRAAAERNSETLENLNNGACATRLPVSSSQTELKETCTQPKEEENNPVTSQGRLCTRPSVSSQTGLKELKSSDGIDETSVGREQARGSLTSETEPKQQLHVTNHFLSEPYADAVTGNSTCLPQENASPRTIYDNVSPVQATNAQQFCFRDRERYTDSRFVASPNAPDPQSRYDNYNSESGQRLGVAGRDKSPLVNMSERHQISNLKEGLETAHRPSPVLELNSHQSCLPSPPKSSQNQECASAANQSPTLYDNVANPTVNSGNYLSQQVQAAVVVSNPGTEIADLKTGLEQVERHYQPQDRLHLAAEMENVGSASLVSSVAEPSLLASSAVEQEDSGAGGRMEQVNLGELTLSTEHSPRHFLSQGEHYPAGPEASRYDNVSNDMNLGLVARNFPANRNGEAQGVHQVSDGGCVAYSPAKLPVTVVGLNSSNSGMRTGQHAWDGFSTGTGRSSEPGLNPAGDGVLPGVGYEDSTSANHPEVSFAGAHGDATSAAAFSHRFDRSKRGSPEPSDEDAVGLGSQENNNNYKISRNAAPLCPPKGNDERNDDADAEDDDDEENAHSGSAMLKTKKKKPRSKFTKFLTSLLSLSSSSDEDEDYGREPIDDTATTSSKSSDW